MQLLKQQPQEAEIKEFRMKSLLLALTIIISQTAFADEPQLHLLNTKMQKNEKPLVKDLSSYEINNSEMIQLRGFKEEKKQKILAKN